MKFRNLFYLLLALPLVFAACEPDAPEQKVEKEAVLTLTSEATMEFAAEGGAGVITYTAELRDVTRMSPAPEPEVEATCEAEWVENLTVAKDITFDVAANEGEARETKIVVTYSDKSFEVAIKQTAKGAPESVKFEAVALGGYYCSGADAGLSVDNYCFGLADNEFDQEGELPNGSQCYVVDLYVDAYQGAWCETMTIPVGEYSLNLESGEVAGMFTSEFSYHMTITVDGEYVTTSYEAGELVVTETGMTLTVTIEGVEHVVTYTGAMTLVNDSEEPSSGDSVKLEYAKVIYYGDYYTPGTADNFYILLGDKGWDENGWEYEDGNYYKFDTYTECIDKANGIAVPYGTYTIAANYTDEPGNVASAYYFTGDWAVEEAITEGTFTVSEEGFVADVVIAGEPRKIVFKGTEYDVEDASSELEGGGESISTLTDDVSVNITGATVVLDNLGDDYVWGCNNYLVYLFEDAENETGEYMMFDILVPTTATDIAGTYDINDWEEPYTGFSGYYSDYDDEYYGCWYVNLDTEDMAPIYYGSVNIEIADNGTYTFTFECYDDADYEIAGTIVGSIAGAGNDDEGGNTPQDVTMWPVEECICSWSNGSTAADYVFKTALDENDSCDQFKFEFTGLENGLLTDGYYNSEDGTINLNYCMHLYYSNESCKIKSAEATVTTVGGQTTVEAVWVPDNGSEQYHGFKWTGVLPEYDI